MTPEIYHITGGFGAQGAIYGGLVVVDNPIIIFGASGSKFVRNFRTFLRDRAYDNPKIRLYLPSITHNEFPVLEDLNKRFENLEIVVHKDIEEVVRKPRDNYTKGRFYQEMKSLARSLPDEIKNVIGVGKFETYETAKSKVIINHFPGPHNGHSIFLYEEGKLLASGLLGKFLPNFPYYYVDQTSSFKSYREGINFLEEANYDILFHAYDTPVVISDMNRFVSPMNKTMTEVAKEVLECLDVVPKPYSKVYNCFMQDYRPDVGEYKKMKFYDVFLRRHLDMLIRQKLVKVDSKDSDDPMYSRK